jgi:flagellar biogenesis protein FliO
MLSPLTLLSVLPLAMGPVTIDDVSAQMDATAGKLTVAVTTSDPVEAGMLRAKVAHGKLNIYVDQARARADRRQFGGAIAVLPRAEYAKVEVPIGPDLTCAGPIDLTAGGTGFRASISCHRGGAASEAGTEAVPAPLPVAAAALPAKAPPVTVPVTAAAPAAPPAAPVAATAPPVPVTTAAPPAPVTTAVPPTPVVQKAPAPEPPAHAIAAPAPEPPRAASSGSGMALPGLALVAIAIGAVFFARRRAKVGGLIQILESVQLGPKRSLVVARIRGEIMVLGSSEAGITRLGGLPAPAPAPDAVVAEAAADLALAKTTVPPTEEEVAIAALDEGGLLARLFRRRATQATPDHDDKLDLAEFDALLEESFADQELRRKLATGESGRVS